MMIFVVLNLYVLWINFNKVHGIHDSVHHTTMKTVYEVQLDHFEIVNNTQAVLTNVNLRIKKFNRTSYTLSGTFEMLVGFSDDFSVKVMYSSLQGNEYKVQMGPRDHDKLCTFLGAEKLVYPEIHAFSNFPEPGACPALPGMFWLKDYTAKNTQLPELPGSAGNKWKMDIIFYYKSIPEAYMAIYALITPKRVQVHD